MIRKRTHITSKDFDASRRKTFHSALCHLLQTEFPATFGPAVTRLFADRVDELYERFHPPRSRLKVGQVLWTGVAVDDPPCRHKRIEDTRLVPLVLDLVTPQDIDAAGLKARRQETRQKKILRLFRQAFEQGAVLSNPDVALLMDCSTTLIGNSVVASERDTGETVPRRGTVHDMGRSVTHKRIICFKRLVEHKPTSQVATETFHSHSEVEYYVQCLRRIKICSDTGLDADGISQATGHSKLLVEEYLQLIREFDLPKLDMAHSSRSEQPPDG